MKAFLLNFLVRPGRGGAGVLLLDSFHTFSDEHPGGLHDILVGLPRISARGNWMKKLVFCAVFIYLSVYYLFIYCLFVCLLFNYF